MVVHNITGEEANEQLNISASGINLPSSVKLSTVTKSITLTKDSTFVELDYPMGSNPYLWDEFHPNLYSLTVTLSGKTGIDSKKISFGMRKFLPDGKHLTINGR